jgi:hypothetical protein
MVLPKDSSMEWLLDLMAQELSEDAGNFSVTATLDKEKRTLTYKKTYQDGSKISVTVDVDVHYRPILPLVDYKELREKEQLKRFLLFGAVALEYGLCFLVLELVLTLLR